MVEINVLYEGDLHCKATHKPSGVAIETDAPVDNHGKGESFSPTDLLATSLGVCNLTTMEIIMRNEGINLRGSKIRIEKHMSNNLPRRVAKLVVQFDMAKGIPENKRVFLESAAKNCPVAKSIHPDIKVEYSFIYTD